MFPEDTTEAAWNHLLTHKLCMVCGNVGLKVVWKLHARLCDSCEAVFRDINAANGHSDNDYQRYFNFVEAHASLPHNLSRANMRQSALSEIQQRRATTTSPKSDSLAKRQALAATFSAQYAEWLSTYSPSITDGHRTRGRFMPRDSDILPARIRDGDTGTSASKMDSILAELELQQYVGRLPALVRSWIYHIESGFQRLLPNEFADLEAATSVWRLIDQETYTAPAWWSHAAHVYLRLTEPGTLMEGRKPVCEVMCFDERASDIVKTILETLGLSVKLTTARELDEVGAYLWCSSCAEFEQDKNTVVYQWRRAVAHACTAHPSTTPKFVPLSKNLHALAHERASQYASQYSTSWSCGICAFPSRIGVTRTELDAHLRVVHDVPPALLELDITESYAYIQPSADIFKDILPELTVGGILAGEQDLPSTKEAKTPMDGVAGDIVQDEERQRTGLLWCLSCPTPLMRVRAMSAGELTRHLQERHDIRNPVRHVHYSVL